jgi:hypothetical protein
MHEMLTFGKEEANDGDGTAEDDCGDGEDCARDDLSRGVDADDGLREDIVGAGKRDELRHAAARVEGDSPGVQVRGSTAGVHLLEIKRQRAYADCKNRDGEVVRQPSA